QKQAQKEIRIPLEANVYIVFDTVSADEMDILAEKLKLYPEQRYYRLPGLTYIRFTAFNDSRKSYRMDLWNSYFENDVGQKFPAISVQEYKQTFTSVAYRRFPPDDMFAFYITKEGKQEAGKKIYLNKYPAGKPIDLPPQSRGFQIIPYKKISSSARKYRWIYKPSAEESSEKSIPFYLCTEREDGKKC
ncbi:MAG: hypothetical protein D6767_09215, partial [Candidatus Hydrogenedentota bacterium]